MGAGLFHADRQTHRQEGGQTDLTKLIVGFRNFANAVGMSILRQLADKLADTLQIGLE